MVSPFLDKRTLDKIRIIQQSELLQFIDKEQLLKDTGGLMDEPSAQSLIIDKRFTYKSYMFISSGMKKKNLKNQ